MTVYGLGERLVIDSGYGLVSIPGSTQVKRLGKLGESHNQVRIDGIAQSPSPLQDDDEGAGRIIGWGRKDDWAWGLGDATAFYAEARVVRRCVATRLTARAPLIVLIDVVIPLAGAIGNTGIVQQIVSRSHISPFRGVIIVLGHIPQRRHKLHVQVCLMIDKKLGHI